MCVSFRRSWRRERTEPRFWAALTLVIGILVYAAVRLLPPPPAPPTALEPVDVPAAVIPITFTIQGKLNLNQASAEELEALPGIGPALAARIVAYREEHGPFIAVDDLLRVSGIGPKTLDRLQGLVVVGEEE